MHRAIVRRQDAELHLHGFDHQQQLTGLDLLAFGHGHLPHIAGHAAGHGAGTFGQVQLTVDTRGGHIGIGRIRQLPGCSPTLALGLERGLLAGLEGGDAVGLLRQEAAVVAQVEGGRLDAQRLATMREGGADVQKLVGIDRVEADLVEEAQ